MVKRGDREEGPWKGRSIKENGAAAQYGFYQAIYQGLATAEQFRALRHGEAEGDHAPSDCKRRAVTGQFRDHELTGAWRDHRECHVGGDFLLIYTLDEKQNLLIFTRAGTHAELFR
nr:type II toxin-antitoxin system mRNA interferase toxin, RelE/StbE family [Agrobacterium pusense]